MTGQGAGRLAISLALLCTPLALALLGLCALQWASPVWLGATAAHLASSRSDLDVSIGALDVDLFTRHPSTSVSAITIDGGATADVIDVDALEASIDLAALIHGDLVVDRVALRGARLELRREADGALSRLPTTAVRNAASSPPTIRRLELEDVELSLIDVASGTAARVRLSAGGAIGTDTDAWDAELDGTLDGVPLEATATLSSLEALLEPVSPAALAVELALGEAHLTLEGTLDDPTTLAGLALDIEAVLPDTSALPKTWPAPPAGLPPLTIKTHLARDGSFYSVEHLRLTLGRTALDGDVRFDPTSAPPTLYANLAASVLDLDTLAAALAREDEAGDGGTTGVPAKPDAVSTDGLSTAPLGLSRLLDRARGALHLRAEHVLYAALPLESFDLRASLSPRRLALDPFALALADGRVSGSLELARTADGAVAMTSALKLEQLELETLLALGDLPKAARGRLGAELRLWASGDSVAELAASLDGGGFALLTGGTLDTLPTNLGTLSLLRSVKDVLTPWEEDTPIRCGYLDVHASAGVAELERFVIDTERTVLLGQGQVDFAAQTLDLVFEPQAKGLRIPGGAVSLDVGGTFARPTIRPGVGLSPERAAVMLAEVATRALSLVPPLGSSPSPPPPWCDALGGALDAR